MVAARRLTTTSRFVTTTRRSSSKTASTFFTGRWHAYTKRWAFLGRFDLEHRAWPLHRAEMVRGEESMREAAGLPPTLASPVVHHSPGVDAAISLPVAVRALSDEGVDHA